MVLPGKSSSRNSSRSGFRRYIIFSTSTSTGIVLLTLTLGETNAIHVGYGKEMIDRERTGYFLRLRLFLKSLTRRNYEERSKKERMQSLKSLQKN